tara:strand:+ start:251 stop:577 length:327 start_codon:yes stop_codon:yes gene_type:complete
MLSAQNSNATIEVGTILSISEPVSDTYKHIDFPRKNTIIKRGAIADFNGLKGLKVVVDAVETTKNGETLIRLKRNDGKNFFRFYPKVSANFQEALNSGEIQLVQKNNS